ncbi:helix-turn-helix domain-containing protein [Chloroflexota bacterium]
MDDKQQETRLTLNVSEAARILGLSRNSTYEAVKRGEIPSIKFGRRVIIPRAALFKMLDEVNTTRGNPQDIL